MADLVTPDELASSLRRTLDPTSAAQACRMASGWLRPATGLTEWPDPVPDDLWTWAVELAALAYDNVTGRDRVTLGRMTVSWGPEALARREAILEAARTAYTAAVSDATTPQGCFPPPLPYPDPACVPWWSR